MYTNSEIISLIRNSNKFLSSDQKVSDRYLLNAAKTTARNLLRQDKNLIKIHKSDEMFQLLSCIPMETIDISSCLGVNSDIKIARSKEQLPSDIEVSSNGYIIQRVYTLDNQDFNKTTLREFEIGRQLKYNNRKYYWIENNYLYISEPEVECVSLKAFFKDDISVVDCKDPYTERFYCPSYLVSSVLDLVNQKLRLYHGYKDDVGSQNIDVSR